MTYEKFTEKWNAIGIKIASLASQERQYDNPRTAQKHKEVLADLVAAEREQTELKTANPDHVRRYQAEAWVSMRPGRRIEDFPGVR